MTSRQASLSATRVALCDSAAATSGCRCASKAKAASRTDRFLILSSSTIKMSTAFLLAKELYKPSGCSSGYCAGCAGCAGSSSSLGAGSSSFGAAAPGMKRENSCMSPPSAALCPALYFFLDALQRQSRCFVKSEFLSLLGFWFSTVATTL